MDLYDISEELFHNALQYLTFCEVYLNVGHVNKKFNNCTKLLKYEKVTINENRMKKILEKPLNEFRKNFVMPNNILFWGVNFSENAWNFVKKQNIQEIRYSMCNMRHNISIPKNIKRFQMIFCKNIDEKKVIAALEKEKSSLIELELWCNEHLNAESVKKIFSFKLEKLFIYATLLEGVRTVVTSDALKNITNFSNLRELQLYGLHFDEDIDNMEFLKNNKLTRLGLGNCNIELKHIPNIITPSLLNLKLINTEINDDFIEQLSILKKKNLLNIESLNISKTKITSKCFKYLNTLELFELNISDCGNLMSLKGLDIPQLKEISIINGNNKSKFDDDDIKQILQQNLKVLRISHNFNITDVTLKNINEAKLKLNKLWIESTDITLGGIIKYLSNMELRYFVVSKHIDDRKRFIQHKVIL